MLAPDVPEELQNICLKCLNREKRDRYHTAADLADALRGRKPCFYLHWWHLIAASAGAIALLLSVVLVLRLWPAPSSHPLEIQRYQGLNYVGTIGTSAREAVADEDVRIHVQLSRPAYCFVIAFHPNGKQELYPQDEPDVAPTLAKEFQLPRKRNTGFALTDGLGLQAFVLVASPKPLPPYNKWCIQVGAAPWQSTSPPTLAASTLGLFGSPFAQGPLLAASALIPGRVTAAEGVWRFDGQSFTGGQRGPERPLTSGVPKPFEDVCLFLRDCPGVEVIQAVAFPVKSKN